VRALRRHMAERILALSGAGPQARVLSLGCGIGDTELLLAPHVGAVTGIDLSRAAVQQARADAARMGIANAWFEQGTIAQGRYDLVIAVYLLHHLSDPELAELPGKVKDLLAPGGIFYSQDPSRRRLSGALGRLFIPRLMEKYQTPDERELEPEPTAELFRRAGLEARVEMYDFGAVPLAGLFPGWGGGYRAARALDDVLLRFRPIARLGSHFEIIARKQG
jgi:SAM-dependent methyltransferase